jgi:hypothetical protein
MPRRFFIDPTKRVDALEQQAESLAIIWPRIGPIVGSGRFFIDPTKRVDAALTKRVDALSVRSLTWWLQGR